MMRILSVLIFLLMTNQAAAAEMSLNTALRFALEHSPGFLAARQQKQIDELNASNAGYAFFPSIDLSASHGIEGSSPSTKNYPWGSALSLGLTQTLYDNGVNVTNYRIASTERDQATLEYQQARDQLSLNLANEFYQYSLYNKLVGVRQNLHDILDKQYRSVSAQYQQGLKTKRDFLRFKTDLQRSSISLLRAKDRLAQSQAELQRLIGLSGAETQFVPEGVVPLSVKKIPSKMPGMQNHVEYRIRDFDRRVSELKVSLATREVWPRISLTTGVTYSNSNYLGNTGRSFSDTDQLSWNALVTLKFNIWDWGTRRRDVAIARANRDVEVAQITQSNQTLEKDLKQLGLELIRQKSEYTQSQELLLLEKQNFTFLEDEYRRGKVPYIDLIKGLQNLSNAQVGYYTTYYEIQQNLAKYRYHEGSLYEILMAH